MIVEDSYSFIGAASVGLVRRCVQCGDIVDLVILHNRRLQLESVPKQAKK